MNKYKWISRLFLLLLLIQLSSLATAQERITYIHTDALGSPIAASDEDGNFIWRESYEPYGKRLRLQKGSDRPWYTGKYEEDIGLVYYGKRWYNPEIGRFYSVDPVRFNEANIHSFNRYAYANNNPYKFVDPDGEAPMLIPVIAWVGAELANLGFESYANHANPCNGCVILSGAGIPGLPAGVTKLTKFGGATKSVPKSGDKVYRVWGDKAGANGRSWSRTDPRTVDNYRDAAGLPNQNSGRFVTEGTLTNTKGVTQRDALSLHGNKGGLDELVVPNPAKQIRVDRVSGANPEF